jgi:hypothetical protein
MEFIVGNATENGPAGLFGVYGSLIRTLDGVQSTYNWQESRFETLKGDIPGLFGRTFGPSDGTNKNFSLQLPALGAGTYQVAVIAVDNARNISRQTVNFTIVAVEQFFPVSGTFELPPSPPGFPPFKLVAEEGTEVRLKVKQDATYRELQMEARRNARLVMELQRGLRMKYRAALRMGTNTVVSTGGGTLEGDVLNAAGILALTTNLTLADAARIRSMHARFARNIVRIRRAERQAARLQENTRSAARSVATDLGVVGPITIEGNYYQDSQGQLLIGIAGTNFVKGGLQEYDRLEVTGNATLDGEVVIDFIDPNNPTNGLNKFQPIAGATFDIIVASNIVVGDLYIVSPITAGGRTFEWGIVDLPDGREALRLYVTEALPVLSITPMSPSSVEILFPPYFGGDFRLEATSSLSTPAWSEVGRGTNLFNVPTSGSMRFFRVVR